MTILHVFLALVWTVSALGTLVGGTYLTTRYAVEADQADVPLPKAVGGFLLRLLATLVLVSLIIGIPLQLSGA